MNDFIVRLNLIIIIPVIIIEPVSYYIILRVDYGCLDALNIKMMQTGSSDVQKGIWGVLVYPMRMLRIGIIGEPANSSLRGN